MKLTTNIFLCLILLLGKANSLHAQALDNAATQQLEKNVRDILLDLYETTDTFVINPNDAGAKEQLSSRLILFGRSPRVQVLNDLSPEFGLITFEDFFNSLRAKYGNNPAAFVRRLNMNSFKRISPKVFGDSVEVEVYFTQTVAGNHQVPIKMLFSGRWAIDADSKFPYFKRLKIEGSESKEAPANAVPFAPVGTNAYQTYLNEQSLSTVQELVAKSLSTNLPSQAQSVYVSRFSYGGCNIFDAFARSFSVAIASKLSTERQNTQFTTEDPQRSGYEIRGQYEVNGEYFRISTDIFDPSGLSIGKTTNTDLPMQWFAANEVGFIPSDYQLTMAEKRIVTQNMIAGTEALDIKLSTNKGSKGLLFKKNDDMEIYVEVNRPCKVRILYRQADGKLLLAIDTIMTNGMLNRPISVVSLSCIEPYGHEFLLGYATTERFAKLEIKKERFKQDGDEYEHDLIMNSLEEAVKMLKDEGHRGAANKVNNNTPTFASTKIELQTVEK